MKTKTKGGLDATIFEIDPDDLHIPANVSSQFSTMSTRSSVHDHRHAPARGQVRAGSRKAKP
ncbi:hypothetical protein ASC95_29570 [Pelomonas sp. Root1217]|uniref:hypothetical protein n=1 Tax=Pelomonas sp. Root1217 TaxID=1736430 RepID=UPI00070B21F2|nr:hypothetical protein [Pelomonas sp. Root1217]KQV52452.1 hypothetical protein ASC95_29570 [Pelomonas sp. Root1217]